MIACGCGALIAPWWIGVPLIVIGVFVSNRYVVGMVLAVILDTLYGHALSSFPYHTFKYVIAIGAGLVLVALLKRFLRL